MSALKKTTAANNGDSTPVVALRTAQKNLVFSLADEKYGIPLSSIKEVVGRVKITPVPHVPPFFKDLINLRGQIISVIDLRIKLALHTGEYEAKKTSIIITDFNEVVGFDIEQISNDLDISSRVEREYIRGVAKASDDMLVLLLDIGKVLTPEELERIKRQSNDNSADQDQS